MHVKLLAVTGFQPDLKVNLAHHRKIQCCGLSATAAQGTSKAMCPGCARWCTARESRFVVPVVGPRRVSSPVQSNAELIGAASASVEAIC